MIQRLPESVINRIAAGEVVVRPVHAIKELLENSLDAGATEVTVTVGGGGFKSVQVQDNGHGISLANLPVLCERFTTSKLSQFADLETVSTFGFRGEALASISQVSHFSVTTRAAGDLTGFAAKYFEGRLLSEPQAVAQTSQGTRIQFDELFFNSPLRRKSIGSPADEYKKIVELLQRFSLSRPAVSFTCRKWETMIPDFSYVGGASGVPAVAQIFGPEISREIDTLDFQDDLFSISVQLSKPNSSFTGSGWFSLAINERLVECSPIRRLFDQVYSDLVPKGRKSFVTAHLRVPSKSLDVNVHPTKKDVIFANQSEILERLRIQVSQFLKSQNSSRFFSTLSKAPPASAPPQSKKIRTDASQLPLLSQVTNFETSELKHVKTVWVGVLEGPWVLLQHEDSLLAVNARNIAHRRIMDSRRAPSIHKIENPEKLEQVIRDALNLEESGASELGVFDKEKVAKRLTADFLANREALESDCGLEIDSDGRVVTLPFFGSGLEAGLAARLESRIGLAVLRAASAADLDDVASRWFVSSVELQNLWSTFLRGFDIFQEPGDVRELARLSSLYREFERC